MVVGLFGIQGANENGERLVQTCAESDLIMWNNHFKKREVHKYIWVSEVNEEKTLINYLLISRMFKDILKDVNVLRGVGHTLIWWEQS